MGLFENGKRMTIWDNPIKESHGQVWRTEEKDCFYKGKRKLGRAVLEEFRVIMAIYWLSVAVFHWLDYNLEPKPNGNQLKRFRWQLRYFSEQGEILSSCCLSYCLGSPWQCMRVPASRLPDSILSKVSFLFKKNQRWTMASEQRIKPGQ